MFRQHLEYFLRLFFSLGFRFQYWNVLIALHFIFLTFGIAQKQIHFFVGNLIALQRITILCDNMWTFTNHAQLILVGSAIRVGFRPIHGQLLLNFHRCIVNIFIIWTVHDFIMIHADITLLEILTILLNTDWCDVPRDVNALFIRFVYLCAVIFNASSFFDFLNIWRLFPVVNEALTVDTHVDTRSVGNHCSGLSMPGFLHELALPSK